MRRTPLLVLTLSPLECTLILEKANARCTQLVKRETLVVPPPPTVDPTNGLLKPLLHAKLSPMAIKVQVHQLPLPCATQLPVLVTVKVLCLVARVPHALLTTSARTNPRLLAVPEITSTKPPEKVLVNSVLMDGSAQEEIPLTPSVLLVLPPTPIRQIALLVAQASTAPPVGTMIFCHAPMARTP